MLGREPPDLEFHHHEPGLEPVEQQHVDVELIAVDLEAVLAADEGETVAELEQKRLQLVPQGGP